MSLKGKNILITGASSGIGAATARLLAQQGATLHVQGRNQNRLDSLVKSIRSNGGKIKSYTLELTNDTDLKALAESLESVDIVIHSAGVVSLGNVEDAAIEAFDLQYQVNLRTPFLLTQLLLPKLKQSSGQIVFVNSGAGLKANAQWSQYAATKHGLKALADSLREELKQDGVRIISIYPGRTATPMQQDVRAMENADYEAETYIKTSDVAEQITTSLSLSRTAVTQDVVIARA